MPTTYFGNIGIGKAPTANLHLKPGSAVAGTAPLKLTTGTLLAAVEEGAIEFDGTGLFYTDNAGVRKTLHRTDYAGAYFHENATAFTIEDDDYFDLSTSEVSKNRGYSKYYSLTDLSNSIIAAGDTITVGTAGGKVGTGEVMIILQIVEMAN